MQLTWAGDAANYANPDGKIAARDPSLVEDGPKALLVLQDEFKDYLEKSGLGIVWTIVGEKWILGSVTGIKHRDTIQIEGIYRVFRGAVKCECFTTRYRESA